MSATDSPLAATRDILGDLIAFPTISPDSNLDLIAYAAERLEACGARLEYSHDATAKKANLFATLGPERDGGIVLSGHTDVVPADPGEWTSDPFTMRDDDERLFGRGACDMKGFVAATLAMAPRYAALDLKKRVRLEKDLGEGVFVSANTADGSTVLPTPDVNDVLVELHFFPTANAVGVFRHLEFCRQCLWPDLDVHLISTTDGWAQFAVAGPNSRPLLQKIVDDLDADPVGVRPGLLGLALSACLCCLAPRPR